MEAQQFHLKWNNHSLNTLSSFQHLLDTNCLVDVSLTCSSGKIVPAHRMVLAACSDYFYRLFKDLPEKHPVIVFKDASEQILNDLLEFMYRGEVEVDEANLSDFLKFADTLQVKGLSQGDNGNPSWKPKEDGGDVSSSSRLPVPTFPPTTSDLHGTGTPRSTPPIAVKDASKLTSIPEPVATMNKAYHFTSALASLQPNAIKFPNFFPGLQPVAPGGVEPSQAQELYSSLASPNLFNALKRKYPVALGQKPVPGFDNESPALKLPFLKDYFGKGPLPVDLSYGNLKEEDSDDIAEHSPSPHDIHENGNDDHTSRGMESLNLSGVDKTNNGGPNSRKPQGRGSRLERMIAAEYKILSEYSETTNGTSPAPETLPAITPELMKSRRTHSLQLAIGEILHNRASVQSAATKYHIPRETLRRHYQRYLKAMGIQKQEPLPAGQQGPGGVRQSVTPTKAITSSIETLAAVAAAANAAASNEDSSNYSSLLDIGQAYGIWNPGEDNSNDLSGPRDLKIVVDEDEEECSSNEKESPEQLMLKMEPQEARLESSTPTGLRESTNNNNVTTEKSLAAPRILPMETV